MILVNCLLQINKIYDFNLKINNIYLLYNIFFVKMGGGLLQLVAYGAQDIYLTGNPQDYLL